MDNYNEKMREEKRQHIIESSKRVFSEKGFTSVTMQDLIDASKISRGGIYLYFKSVEEVFVAVILQRERKIVDEVDNLIDKDLSFDDVIEAYLSMQKKRLKSIDETYLRASYEYHFNEQSLSSNEFRDEQIANATQTIQKILHYGVIKGDVSEARFNNLVQHIVAFIEGLNVYTLLGSLDDEEVAIQLAFLKEVIIDA